MAYTFTLDGTNVTALCDRKRWMPRLNRPATAGIGFASDLGISVGIGSYLEIADGGGHVFHGRCRFLSDDADQNRQDTTAEFTDPTGWYFRKRLARDDDGDYSKPSFLQTQITAPAIVAYILQNSLDYEGSLELDLGAGDPGGGVDVSGAPNDWPQTLAAIVGVLTDTGQLDLIVHAQALSGDAIGTVELTNGDFGSDLSGSVSYDYETGGNVAKIQRTFDSDDLVNKLRYLLGPRVGTPADPPGDQHWRLSIEQTGAPGGVQTDATASQGAYGVLHEVRIFDGDDVADAALLWRYHFDDELRVRLMPRQLVTFTPVAGLEPNFGIGDRIAVSADARLRGGFSGTQRVFGYTLDIDKEGTAQLSQFVTSPDAG